MMPRTVAVGSLFVLLALGTAQAQESRWESTLYLQQAWPKQTRTNQQIADINNTLGTHFEDWGDVRNLSLGVKIFRRVTPRWLVGVEIDGSRGSISGKETVDSPAGPARVTFEQRYSIFADLMAAAHFLPCPDCTRARPFVLAAAGIGYERDTTDLDYAIPDALIDEHLRVRNSGSFPVATAGLGLDIPLGSRSGWYAEIGGAYFWGRLQHHVSAEGSLAPAPTVLADTDSSGPNVWLGVGWRQ